MPKKKKNVQGVLVVVIAHFSLMSKLHYRFSSGFAHGYIVLSDYAEFWYKVTDFYHPNDEG